MQQQVQRLSQPARRQPVHAVVRPQAPSRARVPRIVNGDGSARVKGDVLRVYMYVSSVEQWPFWYPGIASATRTSGMGGPSTAIGTQYVLEQKLAGFQSLTKYQVTAAEEAKRLVYQGRGKYHTVTDQFVFMPDPNDPSFTFVRYMNSFQLHGTAAALQPMVASVMNRIPEEAVSQLARLLNGSKSPLAAIKVPTKHDKRSATAASAGTSSTARRTTQARAPRDNIFKSFGSLFGSTSSSHAASSTSEEESAAAAALDPKGYYRALGLDPLVAHTLGQDEVKAAFRKLAQTMHPDKAAAGASEARRAEAELQFRAVQEAYEVLRDADRKRVYDQGEAVAGGSVTAGAR